jgi:signal transduction histidine kinase/DNA-binding response OmpR family regulator
MQLTMRLKLFAIIGVAALGLLLIAIAGLLIESRVDRQLATIRGEYIPKIGLADQLGTGLERLGRRFQDAADASDVDLLAEARREGQALVQQVAGAKILATDAAAVRAALDDYQTAAEATTRRLIAGETGEDVIRAVEAMQGQQARVAQLIEQVAGFDEQGLRDAFAAATATQSTGSWIRLAMSGAVFLLVLGLSMWIGRDLYRNLGALATGFRRFGAGDFATPIPTHADDELGGVARDANQMAAQIARSTWVKAGAAGLAEELRVELEPGEVGDRATRFLARYLGAPVGVLYYADPGGVMRVLGRHGVAADLVPPRFAPGEGLVGEAARQTELVVVAAPPGQLPVRSGLVDGAPRAIVLLPLVHGGTVTGVLELGILAEWKPEHAELLLAVRESMAIAIEVARARAATRALLEETQRQAAELMVVRRGLEQKAEELARASTYKSQFLANMSHELRTPLNAILGFSELMYDGAVPVDSPQHKEFLGDILTSGRHLLQLINDVLDLSKVEAGRLEFHPEKIRLPQLVGEVLAILRTAAATGRVQIESAIAPEVEHLVLDPARLKQVLYNYVSNAIKFTPEGGRVAIRATPDGDARVRIEVEDSGIGIAADELGRLFGEFQQLADGKKKGGTGLGLALTRRLVEAQGGTVGVTSTVGKGSVFHAVLPRVTAAAAAALRTHTRPPPFGAALGSTGGGTVLVVEDDARDRIQIVDSLTAAGYAVEIATSGAQAIARCSERRFDAITLDLLLPDTSGLEVLQKIRASQLNGDVPVVVITVVAERGAVAGFAVSDVLQKPVEPEAVVAALTRAGVPPHRPGTILVVDDDPNALRLMAATLTQLGYTTRCEHDGAAALGAARSAPPSAIVLDLIMPGMSGFEFLEQLRRDPAGRRVPVIVWTGKDLTVDERAQLRASANAVVAKDPTGGHAVVAELAAFLPARVGEIS